MIMIMSDEIFQILERKAEGSLSLAVGERLFHREDPIERMYLLPIGAIDLVRYQRDGKQVILHRAQARAVLAEASLYFEHYHCDAVCVRPATVLSIPKRRFERLLHVDRKLAALWPAYLARELQNARYRSELLTRKTVAERLAGWLEMNGGKLPPKGQWKSVASEVGVSPEALYRQLARHR